LSPAQEYRIALIHALEESVLPARAAFDRCWPEAFCFDLLDTSLAVDLRTRGELDDAMLQRFQTLACYAAECAGTAGGTRGILFTCSAFGPAINAVKACLPIPVLRPNEAAFDAALSVGERIGLVVTFPPSLHMLQAEVEVMAAQRGRRISVQGIHVAGALDALKAGDCDTHDWLVAEACGELHGVDVLVLGQFSLARAAPALREFITAPVLTTPDCAVQALRSRLAGDGATCGSAAQPAFPNEYANET
jgi:Asp/Glu/hydantoin racemase